MVSRRAAGCCGTATKRRATGSSRLGPSTPSPSPRVTTISGTEAPSNSSSTTELTTAATGKWTSISERPSSPAKCQTHTSSNSGPRPGIPNLTTGTSTRGKRVNNLHITKLLHSSKMKHCHQPKQHPKQHQEQQLLPKLIRPSVVHSKSLFKGQKSKKRTPANWDSFFCYIFYFIIRPSVVHSKSLFKG